jgi:hypothetical protein
MPNGVRLFYSYAHQDEKLREELDKQLRILSRTGVIDGWHDRKIKAGEDWKKRIDTSLDSADIILLLISADFMASDYCYESELEAAMLKHEHEEAVVIPVILRPVPWKNAPFSNLQALPTDGTPVTQWPEGVDAAFTVISEGIEKVAREILSKRDAGLGMSAKPSVYLAETTGEEKIQSYRKGIASELKAWGYPVITVPEDDLPDESPNYEKTIDSYLQNARFSVHVIGNKYGRTIAGTNDKSVVELQNAIAAEYRKKDSLESLIWIPPEVVPQGSRQEAFHKYLTEERAQHKAELSNQQFESVKDRIIDKLKALSASAPSNDITKTVYVICEHSDRAALRRVKNFIYDHGFKAYVSPSLNGLANGAAYHDRYLISCDATLIYYGTINEDWVDIMLYDVDGAPSRRKSDFLCKAVFLADPQSDYRNPHIEVIKHDGNSLENSLRPFIECLQRNNPSGGALPAGGAVQ